MVRQAARHTKSGSPPESPIISISSKISNNYQTEELQTDRQTAEFNSYSSKISPSFHAPKYYSHVTSSSDNCMASDSSTRWPPRLRAIQQARHHNRHVTLVTAQQYSSENWNIYFAQHTEEHHSSTTTCYRQCMQGTEDLPIKSRSRYR